MVHRFLAAGLGGIFEGGDRAVDIERQGQHIAQQAGAATQHQAGGSCTKTLENPAALAEQGFPGFPQATFEQHGCQFGGNAAGVHRSVRVVGAFQRFSDTDQAAVDPIGLHPHSRRERTAALGRIDPVRKIERDILMRQDLHVLQSDKQMIEVLHQAVGKGLFARVEQGWSL